MNNAQHPGKWAKNRSRFSLFHTSLLLGLFGTYGARKTLEESLHEYTFCRADANLIYRACRTLSRHSAMLSTIIPVHSAPIFDCTRTEFPVDKVLNSEVISTTFKTRSCAIY